MSIDRRRIAGAIIAGLFAALLVVGSFLFADRIASFFEPVSLRTRIEAVSFEPPADWRVASGSAEEIESTLAGAGLSDLRGTLDGLGVSGLTRALALLITDGEPTAALRADLLPAAGQGGPAGIRDAALLTLGLDGASKVERLDGMSEGLPYAGYRTGEGLTRRSVIFVSFVPGIVRLTILAPDAVADLLIDSLAYDPPPPPEENEAPSSSP